MSTYEEEFYWSGPASEVILQGSFDKWESTIHLNKTNAGFAGKARVPFGSKVEYKFIVDGQWRFNPDFPTTYDWRGNLNNYIITKNEPEPEPEVKEKEKETPVNTLPVPMPAQEPLAAPMVFATPVEPKHAPVEPTPAVPVPVPEPVVPEPEPVQAPIVPVVEPEAPKEPAKELEAPAAPELKVEVASPVREEPASKEPVTPVNPTIPVEAVVTPMAVPPSAVIPQEGLDVDPNVGREFIETILSADKGTPTAEREKAEVIAEIPDEDHKVEPATSKKEENSTPTQPVRPVVNGVESSAAPQKEDGVALNSPAEDISSPPIVVSPHPVDSSAIPATPALSNTKNSTPATPASALSTPSKPGPGGKRHSSGFFSFPRHNRKTSQDSTSGPSSPASSLKRENGSRKKKHSFLEKVHDLFHPNHKAETEAK